MKLPGVCGDVGFGVPQRSGASSAARPAHWISGVQCTGFVALTAMICSSAIPVQVVDMAAMKTWPREGLGGARLGKKKSFIRK
jgi:hypothetical protein